ncbi:MAG: DUF3791 domain-containing protein [Porphyromonadaceae bacterium]|jgi:hypothetical protein|nr:DUF3791 domain-containing protein [Porphyromonadaceae bacterium]
MYKKPGILNPVQEFQLFCLESYRNRKGGTGMEAFKDFKNKGVFDFLASGYEVLHTQSKNFIVEEIIEFINQNHVSVSRKH